jgi:hypothetical protein
LDRLDDRCELPGSLVGARFVSIGHGVNFSFKIARKMMEKGILPDTIAITFRCRHWRGRSKPGAFDPEGRRPGSCSIVRYPTFV